ncbi:MAG TPA: PQQ-binding-like beta-propeller repeat protein [Vicinamibacterales bacterium]|nr:PQQ-binding-like beta-propeller repeat protein [Vicinamibacterales bacterium]
MCAAMIKFSVALVAGLVVFGAPRRASAQAILALGTFEQRCGTCHTKPTDGRTPDRETLRQRTPEQVLDALTNGSMKANAEGLTDTQKRMLAEYITERPLGAATNGKASTMSNRCAAKPLGNPLAGHAWNGWGADEGNARYQPAASARLSADQVPKLKLKWAFGFPNGSSAFGQPAVAGGRIFVGSDNGFVYAIDAASGCVYWSFLAEGGVRTAITIGKAGSRYAAYFGDVKANVYAVDAETGARMWMQSAESHPLARVTGAPALYNGRLYVPVASFEEGSGPNPKYECCTFRGSVVAYDAASGDQVWKTFTIPEKPRPTRKNSVGTQMYGPAGAAVWSAPTIDAKRNAVYVATGDAYTSPAAETSDAVMAFDLKTGAPLWTHQFTANDAFLVGCPAGATTRDNCPETGGPDFDFGNSPILRNLPNGKRVLVIGQKSGAAWAIDPDKEGALVWQHKVGAGSALGGIEWGSAADDRNGYFAAADSQLGANAGGLAALNLTDGEEVWKAMPPAMDCNGRPCAQAQSAAITVIPGVVFSGTTNGVMRAYATTDGRILWEFNTARPFETVNGVAAKGGSLNGPGPVVVDGMLFMNSGYAYLGYGAPGNVLLAFGIE